MNGLSKYAETLQSGLMIIERYGNWSVPPWIIKTYGFEKVRSDLRNLVGDHYDLRKYTYVSDAGVASSKNDYYIFEKKRKEGL